MAYTEQTWADDESGGTPLSAERLNHIEDGIAAAAATADDAVPQTRTINGEALSGDITLGASDVGAVPTARTVNGHGLSADVTLDAADVGAVAAVVAGTNVSIDDSDPQNPVISASGGGSSGGDVTGPASSTSGHLAVYADTTGKALADGGAPFSGAYTDLTDLPTLGTAAAADTTDFATAAQGAKADTAVQPGDLAAVATSGAYGDLTGAPARVVESSGTYPSRPTGAAWVEWIGDDQPTGWVDGDTWLDTSGA